jgi:succinate dehydrogenase/fumarate reductase cytochrome b subunit (b558 family)
MPANEAGPSPPTLGARLHALTGVIALGAFLAEHLIVNASALGGQPVFDAWVGSLARSRVATVVEVLVVLLPLGYHAVYGLAMIARRAPALRPYPVLHARLVLLERVTAAVLFVFLAFHLWELRLQRLVHAMPADLLYTRLTAHLSSTWWGVPWIAIGYLLGLAAACFHVANGVAAYWADTRGVTAPAARRRVALQWGGLGLVMFVAGAVVVMSLATGGPLFAEQPQGLSCGPSASSPNPSPPPSSSR